MRAADDDDFVKMRVGTNDGRCLFFDDIGDVGVRIIPAEGADRGSREHDIADEPQPDEQNLQSGYFSTVASSISMTGMSSLIG